MEGLRISGLELRISGLEFRDLDQARLHRGTVQTQAWLHLQTPSGPAGWTPKLSRPEV